jgi:hypothetical protein
LDSCRRRLFELDKPTKRKLTKTQNNKMQMKKLIVILISLILTTNLVAQDDLLKGVEENKPKTEKVIRAFKSTRVINAHSTEMLPKGNLDFRILHRFGPVKNGIKDFFGLDDAYMRMAFDYGLSDNLMIGAGRSTFRKEFDVFAKARVLQQINTATFPSP